MYMGIGIDSMWVYSGGRERLFKGKEGGDLKMRAVLL